MKSGEIAGPGFRGLMETDTVAAFEWRPLPAIGADVQLHKMPDAKMTERPRKPTDLVFMRLDSVGDSLSSEQVIF